MRSCSLAVVKSAPPWPITISSVCLIERNQDKNKKVLWNFQVGKKKGNSTSMRSITRLSLIILLFQAMFNSSKALMRGASFTAARKRYNGLFTSFSSKNGIFSSYSNSPISLLLGKTPKNPSNPSNGGRTGKSSQSKDQARLSFATKLVSGKSRWREYYGIWCVDVLPCNVQALYTLSQVE